MSNNFILTLSNTTVIFRKSSKNIFYSVWQNQKLEKEFVLLISSLYVMDTCVMHRGTTLILYVCRRVGCVAGGGIYPGSCASSCAGSGSVHSEDAESAKAGYETFGTTGK